MRSNILILIAFISLLLVFPATNFARILNVPDDYETIQAAIDDAAVNEIDTVMIADGTYSGAGNINLAINRRLVLTSLNGALETTIDCEEAADSRAIFATTSTTISGLTIKRATSNGLRVDNAGELLIENCRFAENNGAVAQQSGGAIQLRTCAGTIRNCIFQENTNIGSGGAIVFNTSQVTIEGCLFLSNQADRFGGGILITNNSTIPVFNCLFAGNTAGIDGGGIAFSLASAGQISFSDFIENEAAGLGGGIYKGSNSNPNVINCIFYGNRAETGDQLAAQDNGGEITISYCLAEGGPDEAGRWDGENIIDEEPVFVDGREPAWGLNGYYLDQEESPAVDAGSDAAENLGVAGLTTNPNLRRDTDQADLGFHYWIGWFEIYGRLFGRVLELTDDAPIAGAMVTTTLNQLAISDDEGNWEIERARIGLFDVSAEIAYHNPVTISDQELEEDQELEITLRLPHPEFRLSVEDLSVELGLDDTTVVQFEAINDGNGPVVWSGFAKLGAEHDQDPWESIASFDIGNQVEDSRISGIAYDGEHYYASGADANNLPPKIYVFDANGEYESEFAQLGIARFGMRDLAWDGELLWGASNQDLIGFTIEGDSIRTFRGPANPTYSITYDNENELYWASSITSDIFGYDREGNQVARIARGEMRIYGLGYWADDPDGATIYVHGNSAAEANPQVFKVNPANGQITQLALLNVPANSSPEGCEVVSGIDPYSITMIANYNFPNGDYVNLWRLGKRDDWFGLDPTEGTIEGGESIVISLTLAATGFDEGVYEAEAHFTFDAVGDTLFIPINMEVVSGNVHAVRTVPLPFGWSLVSSHLELDEPDIRAIMRPLVEDGSLLFMKDTEGRIYAPRLDEPFINMLPWDVEKAYWIKVSRPSTLQLEGTTVFSNQPIQLDQGWNGTAYFPRVAMDPARAFSGIAAQLELVRDGEGRFMFPRYNFTNLPPCRHGNGYQVRVSEDCELIWGGGDRGDFLAPSRHIERIPSGFEVPSPTGSSMSLLVIAHGQEDVEIAVKSAGKIIGGGVIGGGLCGIAVFGDDPSTPEVEGAKVGDELSVERLEGDRWDALDPKILEGGLAYTDGGVAVLELTSSQLPTSTLLIDAYPNPFNSTTSIRIALPHSGRVSVALYDLEGREIERMFEGQMLSGSHRLTLSGTSLTSGLYFVRVRAAGAEVSSRLLLLR